MIRSLGRDSIASNTPGWLSSWPALWDSVRHLGSRHAVGLQHLSRMLEHHGRGPKHCPLCEEQLSGVTLTDHVLSSHCLHTLAIRGALEEY